MLEVNKVYDHFGRKMVYRGEDKKKWKLNSGIEDLVFITPSEEREDCMLEITISKNIFKLDGENFSVNGQGSIGTTYIYRHGEYDKFKELKSIYENAIKQTKKLK